MPTKLICEACRALPDGRGISRTDAVAVGCGGDNGNGAHILLYPDKHVWKSACAEIVTNGDVSCQQNIIRRTLQREAGWMPTSGKVPAAFTPSTPSLESFIDSLRTISGTEGCIAF